MEQVHRAPITNNVHHSIKVPALLCHWHPLHRPGKTKIFQPLSIELHARVQISSYQVQSKFTQTKNWITECIEGPNMPDKCNNIEMKDKQSGRYWQVLYVDIESNLQLL